MKLLDNWKYIAKKAASFWIGIAAFLLTSMEMAITVYGDDWISDAIPRWARMSIIMFIAGAAPIARLIAQRNMRDEPKREDHAAA